MTKRHHFLILWLAVVGLIFAWTQVSYHAQFDPQLKSEILLRHGLLMLVLTLPSGWALAALVGGILNSLGIHLTGMADVFFVSITCAVAGFFQWFIFLPWLWRKLRVK